MIPLPFVLNFAHVFCTKSRGVYGSSTIRLLAIYPPDRLTWRYKPTPNFCRPPSISHEVSVNTVTVLVRDGQELVASHPECPFMFIPARTSDVQVADHESMLSPTLILTL